MKGTQGYRCPSMIHDRPWLYEADNFGAACCVHLLLHFERLQLRPACNGWHEKMGMPWIKPPKRCWQRELWTALMQRLLLQPSAIDGDSTYGPLAAYISAAPSLVSQLAVELAWQQSNLRGKR
eukprot:SAG31_NODE_698_length_12746_cov_3.495136_11_plen_123_part_00